MLEKLILGTVQMGLDYGINNSVGKVSTQDAFRILDFAMLNGIDTLDTAELYGDVHQLIGSYNQNHKNFKIITKFPKIALDVKTKINFFREELKVAKLEGILFHSFDSLKLNISKLGELESLKREGILEKIGVSIYTNEEFDEAIGFSEINIIQLPFNLLDNFSLRVELIQKAKNKGKEIHVRSVFLQGLFFKNPTEESKVVSTLRPQLLALNKLAKEYGISISSLALSYCLNQTLIDKVIIGVDKLDQLKENIAQVQILDKELINKIDKLVVYDLRFLNPTTW